jgi:hypothetical protein
MIHMSAADNDQPSHNPLRQLADLTPIEFDQLCDDLATSLDARTGPTHDPTMAVLTYRARRRARRWANHPAATRPLP